MSQADGSGLAHGLAVYTNHSFNLSVPQFLICSTVSSSEGLCDSSMIRKCFAQCLTQVKYLIVNHYFRSTKNEYLGQEDGSVNKVLTA